MKKGLISKAGKGIASGDVANALVRNLLSDLSKSQDTYITNDYILKTLEFFDFKCPYTDEELFDQATKANIMMKLQKGELEPEDIEIDRSKFQLDHIVPHNRESCGLNLYGNLVWVKKEANSKKRNLNFEDFINSYDEIPSSEKSKRIQKIKDFQKFTGYDIWISKTNIMKKYLEDKYNEVMPAQEENLKYMLGLLNAKTTNPSTSSKAVKKLPKWTETPTSKVHKIIKAFIELEQNSVTKEVSIPNLLLKCPEAKKSDINSLKTDIGNNYGKLFENGSVKGTLKFAPDIEQIIDRSKF